GAANQTMMINASGTGANYTNSSIADGSYTFIATCNDTANNYNTSDTYNFLIDTLNPDINFTNPTPSNDSTQSNTDIYVNVTSSDTSDHYSFIDFDDSLVGWWRMDDTNSSGDPIDLSSYSNNGTAFGNAVQTDLGYWGKGFEFDGDGDYIEVPGLDNSFSSSFTVSGWIKTGDKTTSPTIISDYYFDNSDIPTYYYGWELLVSSSKFTAIIGDKDAETSYSHSTDINDSSWHHFVAVFGSGGGLPKLYVDDVASNPDIGPNSISSNAGRKFRIADQRLATGSGNQIDAMIDEILIFNRTLTAAEISALYNASANQYENNFTNLDYDTHEFTGYAVDIAGNKNETEQRTVTIDSTPTTPTPSINSTDGTNSSSQDLNCFDTLVDADGDAMNVTVKWYNNSVLVLTMDYNNSYANNSFFTATLDSANTTAGEVWNCSMRLFDGAFYSDWGASGNLTINTAPAIVFVQSIASMDPLENTFVPVIFTAIVTDADGADSINTTSVKTNFTRTGEVLRQNTTCAEISGQNTTTSKNFSCTVDMWYFDANGNWNVAVYTEDLQANSAQNTTTTFQYNLLKAMVISPPSLSLTVTTGAMNQTPSEPTLINNTGNYNVSNISLTTINLYGETYTSFYIDVGNFTIDIDTGGTPPAECAGGTSLTNGTAVNITNSLLDRGNHSVNDGVTGQEQFYYCIPEVPPVPTQPYSTSAGGSWTITILAAAFVLGNRRKRKKSKKNILEILEKRLKKRKISLDELTALEEKLRAEYGTTISQLLTEAIKVKPEIKVPIDIFKQAIGPSEALCKFLKENKGLTYHEIALTLNRNDRTVWLNYRNAVGKKETKIKVSRKTLHIPVNIFTDRRLSILETAVNYLREKGLKNAEVAELLNKDPRNIWTLYSRAVRKLGK
ncbi:MAG: hypothetical protein KJ718_03130, partial [Nanoarchaeota archaeon]|nr:hypothetical protein [Nanoarchaeota archaeon]